MLGPMSDKDREEYGLVVEPEVSTCGGSMVWESKRKIQRIANGGTVHWISGSTSNSISVIIGN